MKRFLTIILLVFPSLLYGQGQNQGSAGGGGATVGSGAPSNPCTRKGAEYVDNVTGGVYYCPSVGGNWSAEAAVGGGPPTGSASGDLGGTYPSPTVVKVNGAAIPASAAVASTNGSNRIIAAPLTSAHLWVGNVSNLPVDVALSGDCSLSNAGAITCTKTGNVAFGTLATLSTVTKDQVNSTICSDTACGQNTTGTAANLAGNNAIPTQTGNNGKVLGTNGTSVSWVDNGIGSVTSSGSPVAGNIPKFTTATNIAPAAYSDIVTLWASGVCSGFLKNDGTCSVAPGATIPSTTNLIAGDGAGNGADSSLAVSAVTAQGNTFNAASKLVQLDGSAHLPALDGSALTNLNATNLTSGTVSAARIPPAAASALGGVNSKDCSAGGQFIQKINVDGSITCQTPSGGADFSTNTTSSTVNEIVIFGDTGGKLGTNSSFLSTNIAKVQTCTNKFLNKVDNAATAGNCASVTSAYVDTSVCSNASCSQNTSGSAASLSAPLTLGASNLTTRGDLLTVTAGPSINRLAKGTQYQVLTGGASDLTWGQVNLAQATAVTGVLPNANTTATNANTASTIVARDASGNFIAGTPVFTHITTDGVTSTGATGTGKFVFDAAPTITGHPTIEGVTSTGAQGTGALVFATGPVLGSPHFTAPTIDSGNITVTAFSSAGVVHNNASGVLSSSAVVAADTDTSIAHTGVDINTSHQVTATHITGGTNTDLVTFNSGNLVNFSAPTPCTNQFVTGLSAAGALTCTTATLAGSQFANQGSSANNVLHGNPSGNPTWAQVNLTNDTTGSLALSKLATQAADTVVMNNTASTAAPVAVGMPVTGTNGCSGTLDVLQWNNTSTPHAIQCRTLSTGGNTSSTTMTSGTFPVATGANSIGNSSPALTISGNSLQFAGVDGIVSSGPITAGTSAGVAGVLSLPEGTAPSGSPTNDLVYAGTSSSHRLMMNNNNGTPAQIVASGVDINTSDQVTATHLTAALPQAQGGTAADMSAQGGACNTTGARVWHQAASNAVTSSCLAAVDLPATLASGTAITNAALTTPSIGAATGTSLLATGIVDGVAPTTITTTGCVTGTHCALGGTYKSGYTFNNYGTAATTSFYDLPSVANTVAGMQYCVTNGYGAGGAVTGAISVTPLTTALIAIKGVVGTANHAAVSGGAAGDSACFVAVDTTHWIAYVQSGTWTTP